MEHAKNLTNLGLRLKQERERLGLTQDDVSDMGDVSRRTVAAWERGEQSPNGAFLALAAERGFDVLFILTNIRRPPQEGSLSEAAATLLQNYENADANGRSLVEGVAALAGGRSAAGRASGPVVQIGGDVGQHIAGLQTVAGPMTINVGKGRK